MGSDARPSARRIVRFKTVCVGESFDSLMTQTGGCTRFPASVLAHADDFQFECAADPAVALQAIQADQDVDLVFLDADTSESLTGLALFCTQLHESRPAIPLILFSEAADDTMRYLMRCGATWHYLKSAPQIERLAADLHERIFLPLNWQDVYAYYARDGVKPRIEPGFGFNDVQALQNNAEEQYIIKRLFANSDVVQIFRIDEGFSGSRIYTVKPQHQLKRILKIGMIDEMEAVQDKQERLIQPRLYRQVGQINGKIVQAEHLAGACYSLAGSNQEVLTLTQFLLDHNRVRKDLLDKLLQQLRASLRELYNGSVETELRYWAPLYSRVLPPLLTLESAVWVDEDDPEAPYTLNAADMANLSAVASNSTLNRILSLVRRGHEPDVILRGFEIAEVDRADGVLYLQDTLVEQYPADPLLRGKEHPILRFKIRLQPSQLALLKQPVFRRGKKVVMRGVVIDTQETVLARHMSEIMGRPYDFEQTFFQFASAGYLSPLENIRFLLWEVGREDMIAPVPVIAPVIHGDLNTGNILVEADSDTPLWLIDFSDARAGHHFFDLAKLESEFRTHVFYRLFNEMVEERVWDVATATKFLLLVENLLLLHSDSSFETFAAALRDHESDWYDDLYTQFPLYYENLLYFLFSLRQIARSLGPDRFRQHYPVAVFFHSIAALKYRTLDRSPWRPWARRAALCCALVHGKEAIMQSRRPQDITRLLGRLRQRSALALIAIGQGEEKRYLMQWNKNWGRFNLVGGRINNQAGDRDSFARALQRKMEDELGLRTPKDYHILRERQPVIRQQFSRRQHIFKDYEFRVFEIELQPRHPRSRDEFKLFAQRLASEHENVLLSEAEINYLRTANGRPISETTRIVLQVIGEIAAFDEPESETYLDFQLDELRPLVSRGRAQISGKLVNVGQGKLLENITIEVLARSGYEIEPASSFFYVQQLDAGFDHTLQIDVQPREQDAKLTLRVTYYDTRGKEYQQLLEQPLQFRTPVLPLFQLDNPYVTNQPLDSGTEDMFVGREDVFAWLGAALLGPDRLQSLILTGQARIGKTSLLLQLVNGTLGRAIRMHAEGVFLPIYGNIRDLEVNHTGQLFDRISQIISRNLRNRGIAVFSPDIWPHSSSGFALFDQFLDEIENNLAPNGRLLLVLDDLDYLRSYMEEGWVSVDTLAYLRSLMLHRSRIAIVGAGTSQLADPYWRLINEAAESRELGRLAREDTERLVREPVQPQVRFDDLAVEKIWSLTGGHPYLVQLACSCLMRELAGHERQPATLGLPEVGTALDHLLGEEDGYLSSLWENCSPKEKLVLSALAVATDGHRKMARTSSVAGRLSLRNREAYEGLDRTMTTLTRKGLLIKAPQTIRYGQSRAESSAGGLPERDDAFGFAFDLMRLWLAENHPLSEALQTVHPDRALFS